MKNLLINLIEFYQASLSMIFFQGACRFEVSCSEFTKQQIKELGVAEGSLTGLKRIWSCR